MAYPGNFLFLLVSCSSSLFSVDATTSVESSKVSFGLILALLGEYVFVGVLFKGSARSCTCCGGGAAPWFSLSIVQRRTNDSRVTVVTVILFLEACNRRKEVAWKDKHQSRECVFSVTSYTSGCHFACLVLHIM